MASARDAPLQGGAAAHCPRSLARIFGQGEIND